MCPSNVRISFPVRLSQRFNFLSALMESKLELSGENATERTSSECPLILRSRARVFAFHKLRVLSWPPDGTCLLSGEKAMDLTGSESPLKLMTVWGGNALDSFTGTTNDFGAGITVPVSCPPRRRTSSSRARMQPAPCDSL